MERKFGVDPYGAPDPKMGSFRPAESRGTNGNGTNERAITTIPENIVEVPIGQKRFVPRCFQGIDPYGAPDPKSGFMTFDARTRRPA